MKVEAVESLCGKHGFYFRATCGKKTALVQVHPHGIHVVCENASHKTWSRGFGPGKLFRDAEDAVAAYKSTEMKTIIHAALAASLQD